MKNDFTLEAIRYFDRTPTARFPPMTRENSISYIESLYRKGAISVEVFIAVETVVEIIIRFNRLDSKCILLQIMKGKPTSIVETADNSFRVGWKKS